MKHEPPAELSLPRELPDDFVPTPPGGLTQEEAHRRLQDGKGNKSTATPGKSMWQVLSGHLFTLFNLLNVGMALLLVSVRAYRNMLFMGVILSNVLIGTIQEIRAYRTVQKMKLKSESPVSVLRDGAEIRLSPDDLVQGDLVVLRRGDQIPADAVVRDGSGAANESLVTGESRPVYKREGACLLSGSFISSGTLVAQLTRVGDDSYISRLQHSAKKIKQPASQLLKEDDR